MMPSARITVNTYVACARLFSCCDFAEFETGSDFLSLRAPVVQDLDAFLHSGVDAVGVEAVFG